MPECAPPGRRSSIYRGRHRHVPTGESALARLAGATLFRHAVWGPREFFYADLFATRKTGCRSQLGLPGARDAHAGCVGAHMVEQDLFDFLLLSLPDNDTHSHRLRPRVTGRLARGGRPSDRAAHGSRRRERGLPRRTCGDRPRRPLPHLGRGQHLPARRVRRPLRPGARRRRPDGRGPRPLPGPAVRDGLRARPRAARGDRGGGARRGRRRRGHRPRPVARRQRRAPCARRGASCASRPAVAPPT